VGNAQHSIYEIPGTEQLDCQHLITDSKIRCLKMPSQKLQVVCGDEKSPNCRFNLNSGSGPLLAGDIPIPVTKNRTMQVTQKMHIRCPKKGKPWTIGPER